MLGTLSKILALSTVYLLKQLLFLIQEYALGDRKVWLASRSRELEGHEQPGLPWVVSTQMEYDVAMGS